MNVPFLTSAYGYTHTYIGTFIGGQFDDSLVNFFSMSRARLAAWRPSPERPPVRKQRLVVCIFQCIFHQVQHHTLVECREHAHELVIYMQPIRSHVRTYSTSTSGADRHPGAMRLLCLLLGVTLPRLRGCAAPGPADLRGCRGDAGPMTISAPTAGIRAAATRWPSTRIGSRRPRGTTPEQRPSGASAYPPPPPRKIPPLQA